MLCGSGFRPTFASGGSWSVATATFSAAGATQGAGALAPSTTTRTAGARSVTTAAARSYADCASRTGAPATAA